MLLSGREQTFLAILKEEHEIQAPDDEPARVIETCIGLELCAKRIYATLATRFAENGELHSFFTKLSEQENDHAELLGICQALAPHGRWFSEYVTPWKNTVLGIEKQLHRWEQDIDQFNTVEDVLKLVIAIEDSEVNHAFSTIVMATDSKFVRAIDAFRDAGHDHINYICWTIPAILPALRPACANLAGKYGLSRKLAA